VTPHDLDRLPADRACCPEQGDAFHPVEVYGRPTASDRAR
jgi:hypothetical protein